MQGLTEATVVARRDWAPGLATFTLSTSLDFKPGQFFNLGLYRDAGFVSRSYSAASAPGRPLEVLLARVEGGALTPSFFDVAPGGSVYVDPKPQGFFCFDYVPDHRHLWLLATGTGLGPYLSMLRSGAAFARAERVVLAHGVRDVDGLAHREELAALAVTEPRFRYLPLLSRDDTPGFLHGRLTERLRDGSLERSAELGLEPESAHILLCGNPDMIADVTALLGERGLRRHRQRNPGHITTEKYW